MYLREIPNLVVKLLFFDEAYPRMKKMRNVGDFLRVNRVDHVEVYQAGLIAGEI